jgi:hypothetical protein
MAVVGRKKNGHKLTCGCPICLNMKKKGGDESFEESSGLLEQEIVVPEEEVKNDNEVFADDSEYKELDLEGGAKKRRTKRNKKSRSRKTRRHRRRSHKNRK